MLALRVPVTAFGLCAALMNGSPAAADEPFYKGKRLTLIVNFAAGGPTDIEGRLSREASRQAHRRPTPASSCRTWMAPAA